MKISVVVCTYQGEAYVAEQLRTLLTQSRLPDEIIIGDDASTDGTWAIVQAFGTQARARGIVVTLLRHPSRLGYVANFSASLSLAGGDIVFLCDQDDAWHADKIALMMGMFVANPELLFVHSDARLVDAEGKDLGHGVFEALEVSSHERKEVVHGDAFTVYLRRNLATGAASAFRRSLLEVALPLPADWVHDAWLAILAAATGRIAMLDDALVDYRQHGANEIGLARRSQKQRFADLFRPRNEIIRADADRMQVLVRRLEDVGAPQACVEATRSMDAHLRRRLTIGAQPLWLRSINVTRELTTGRYSRFGTGIRSAIRDLLRIG